ncbi:hypothetical protein EST38_g4408 [Candolleomyces aberdarensis]|uniref:Prephenate/arogenate dehydrogenase domain-containing protein n=1 Tax=Candolleomyces aberdarensis TaxID=2316362 RepID=A0A4Q2DN69_9AGAR|nr:hypothetical protein EST38_g4408 [Candolleomyces aberdarensis]
MGRMIHVCDLPDKFEGLQADYANTPNVVPMKDGHAVARSSDFIVYSVEAEYIDRVVAEYGPSTKLHAVVAGQTSVKAPERLAFEKHLPSDVHIVSCHSLHGPSVSPIGQPLVLIKHRGTDEALTLVESILSCLKSRFVYLTYEEHDSVTANTQAVTHAAFLSMGTAWASSKAYPWEQGLYVGGIETVKVNLTLRIYSNAWHVYAGLAILNPSARIQIDQYAKSATELFKLMLQGGAGSAEAAKTLRERVEWGRETVFGDWDAGQWATSDQDHGTAPGKKRQSRQPILLSAELLDKFSLGIAKPPSPSPSPCTPNAPYALPTDQHLSPPLKNRPNSHLSLLAMVDCWAHLGINPYHHLSVAATPLFRLFLGVAEHLFLSESLLRSAINSALFDSWHRPDDLEFVVAARGWSQCVSFGNFEVYRRRFDETRTFFDQRFEEAGKLGSEMIKAVMESELRRESKDDISDVVVLKTPIIAKLQES